MEELQHVDTVYPSVRAQFALAEAEYYQRAENVAAAARFAAIDAALREAREHPETFLGFSRFTGRDAVELAERAAVADLAMRMKVAENTVRANGYVAEVLRERTPLVWAWFREGDVSTANAREVSAVVAVLPGELWARFDEVILDAAKTLAPARFRTKVRSTRDRLQSQDLAERHERALTTRTVWSEHDRDGMGWLSIRMSSEKIALAVAEIDARAFELFTNPGETRTMAQLRSDVAAELLIGTDSATKARVAVALTVPVLSLLGHSDEPAILEGVGPIDIDTARQLAGDSPTLTRILTDPVTGQMLALDPDKYPNNAATRRWLAHRDVTCGHPGCGRRAAYCDIDHIRPWNGSNTIISNLVHLCRKHHRMKHTSKWQLDPPDKPGGPTIWTSPTGSQRTSDPPPY